MPRVLIVAYGNPLRCDDSIAWRVADALEGKFLEQDVEIIRLHQLAPEIADNVRNPELVLFIDAACVDEIDSRRPGDIQVREESIAPSGKHAQAQFTHVYSPARVLELARELYQANPKAFVITVAGEDFGHGDRLSAPVASALPELVVRIERLVEDSLAKARTTKASIHPCSG
ncbi:MAG TPA: hydrogenase maturation protease [Candidatus Binatia bacterium]|nr:hydrogenase maturation protease [Candidatus Binatia bacterium]